MKYFLIVMSLFAVANCDIPPDVIGVMKTKLTEFAKVCQVDVQATDDELAPIKQHKLPTTPAGNCFVACMYKKFGFLDKEGKIDKPATYDVLNNVKGLNEELYDKMKKIADVCLAEVTDAPNECDTAYNALVCVHREKEVVGLKLIDFE